MSVEIKEEKKGKSTGKFGQLTAFAEGDKDAEREIFSGYISELEELIGLLGNAKADDLRKKIPLFRIQSSRNSPSWSGKRRSDNTRWYSCPRQSLSS